MNDRHACRKLVAVIILAAGLGTRMKSEKAKVLHELMGRPMIRYSVETARKAFRENIILVVGHQAESVQAVVSETAQVTYAYQNEQLGTGHAVLMALPQLKSHIRDVVILCGDVPLLRPDTLGRIVDAHVSGRRDLTLLAVNMDNPTGYGRLVLDRSGNVLKIVEETDADPAQKQIKTINSGIYCVGKETLFDAVHQIESANAQGEMYLTDIVEIANKHGKSVGVLFLEDREETLGINTVEDLAVAEEILRRRSGKIA